MGQGNVFTLFVRPHLGGGGYPSPRFFPRSFPGGYPSPGWGGGGTPVLVGEYHIPGQKSMEYPQPGQEGVPPGQVRMGTPQLVLGYPLARSGWGYPPGQVRMGYPLASSGWVTLPPSGTEQQSEYLLHSGWYASCGQAGGLSCSSNQINFKPNLHREVSKSFSKKTKLSPVGIES